MVEMSERMIWGRADKSLPTKTRQAAYLVMPDRFGRVSAVKGTGGHLFLPGGGIEEGETAEVALRREVMEELGRNVALSARVAEGTQYFVYAGHSWQMEVTIFSGELGEQVRKTHQHPLIWAEPGELVHECMQWAAAQVAGDKRGRPRR